MYSIFLALTACSTSDGSKVDSATDTTCDVVEGRPASWDDQTHGKLAAPDYDRVFDTSLVHRVDIAIPAEDYAAMYAELEGLSGMAFGSGETVGQGDTGFDPGAGGGDNEEIAEAMAAACEGLAEGDACTVDLGGMTMDGTCEETDGVLLCTPEMGGDPGSMGGGAGDLSFLPSDPSYHAVTVDVDGGTWCGVGMRFKGNATLVSAWQAGVSKLPFRLDFDHFEEERPELDDQRFHGFKEVTFGNGNGDATLLHDVLASEILEDRGVPAARNASTPCTSTRAPAPGTSGSTPRWRIPPTR